MTSEAGAFEATPAAQWVDPHPAQEVTLPSGNRAVVKMPNLYILARTGQVPDKVQKAAERRSSAQKSAAKRSGKASAGDAMTRREALEELEDVELYVDWIICRAFVSPRVTLSGGGGSVAASALTAEDKVHVVTLLGIEV